MERALQKKQENARRESTKAKAQSIFDWAIAQAEEGYKASMKVAEAVYAQTIEEAEALFEQEKATADEDI